MQHLSHSPNGEWCHSDTQDRNVKKIIPLSGHFLQPQSHTDLLTVTCTDPVMAQIYPELCARALNSTPYLEKRVPTRRGRVSNM